MKAPYPFYIFPTVANWMYGVWCGCWRLTLILPNEKVVQNCSWIPWISICMISREANAPCSTGNFFLLLTVMKPWLKSFVHLLRNLWVDNPSPWMESYLSILLAKNLFMNPRNAFRCIELDNSFNSLLEHHDIRRTKLFYMLLALVDWLSCWWWILEAAKWVAVDGKLLMECKWDRRKEKIMQEKHMKTIYFNSFSRILMGCGLDITDNWMGCCFMNGSALWQSSHFTLLSITFLASLSPKIINSYTGHNWLVSFWIGIGQGGISVGIIS